MLIPICLTPRADTCTFNTTCWYIHSTLHADTYVQHYMLTFINSTPHVDAHSTPHADTCWTSHVDTLFKAMQWYTFYIVCCTYWPAHIDEIFSATYINICLLPLVDTCSVNIIIWWYNRLLCCCKCKKNSIVPNIDYC